MLSAREAPGADPRGLVHQLVLAPAAAHRDPGLVTRALPSTLALLVVLGGCGGIGRAYVAGLLAHGAAVAVLDLPASIAAHPPAPLLTRIDYTARLAVKP